MTKTKMKYVKRYNKFSLQTNCRICLTQSVGAMTELISPLKPDLGAQPTLFEALELVMDEYVDKDKKYPNSMCGMCREFLKISYDLKVQYKESQEQLRSCFKESEEEKNCKLL